MDKSDWQKFHGFSDEAMSEIDYILKFFKGRIVGVRDLTPAEGIKLEER